MIKRASRQREAILRYLRGMRCHPTADDIYEEVKRELPHISKGTVYRNLQVLQQAGEVVELDLNGTVSRFEAKRENHYHFRCDGCGRVTDLDEPVDDGLDRRVGEKTGFKIFHHQTEFSGLCRECQAKLLMKQKGEKCDE